MWYIYRVWSEYFIYLIVLSTSDLTYQEQHPIQMCQRKWKLFSALVLSSLKITDELKIQSHEVFH